MSRVELPIVVTRVSGGNLIPVSGAAVAVTDETGAAATVYAAETGSTTQSPVESDANGRVTGYVEVGHKYTCSISHADITTYTEVFAPGWQGGSKGKAIIATQESIPGTSYSLLTTPDRVSNLILPTDGLIFYVYQARWVASAASGGYAGVFLSETQVQMFTDDFTALQPVQARSPQTAGEEGILISTMSGLYTPEPAFAMTTAPATTGMVVGVNDSSSNGAGFGGIGVIYAAAGTYDLSVRFKLASGTGQVRDRKLWAWSMAF